MIEEIDSITYKKHFFDKVFQEVGSDPHAFLAASLDYVAQESSFFAQPGAAMTVAQLAQRHLPSRTHPEPARAPAAPAKLAAPMAAAAVAAPLTAPASSQPPMPAAVPVTEPTQLGEAQPPAADEEEEEEEHLKEANGMKPNAGNGANMGAYSWTQTLGEVVVSVPVPPGTKGRACDVHIARDKLRVGLKGQPPVLDGPLFATVVPDDCLWNLVDGRHLELTLQKQDGMQWWRCVVSGEPEIDAQKVEPEPSKLTDLEPEMRATVEKMMYDQRQKAMGRPTSDEQQKADLMKQFMKTHPELDFSNAKIEM